MIWRLFRPRPIFVLTIPHTMVKEDQDAIREQIKQEMGKEYNVIVLADGYKTYVETKILK